MDDKFLGVGRLPVWETRVHEQTLGVGNSWVYEDMGVGQKSGASLLGYE